MRITHTYQQGTLSGGRSKQELLVLRTNDERTLCRDMSARIYSICKVPWCLVQIPAPPLLSHNDSLTLKVPENDTSKRDRQNLCHLEETNYNQHMDGWTSLSAEPCYAKNRFVVVGGWPEWLLNNPVVCWLPCRGRTFMGQSVTRLEFWGQTVTRTRRGLD
jgi:hypothetical protein